MPSNAQNLYRPLRAIGISLPLCALLLSACSGDGPPEISLGPNITIGLDKPRCITAGNPNACRLQRELAGEFTQPNVRSR